jgi:hypothetical protein
LTNAAVRFIVNFWRHLVKSLSVPDARKYRDRQVPVLALSASGLAGWEQWLLLLIVGIAAFGARLATTRLPGLR